MDRLRQNRLEAAQMYTFLVDAWLRHELGKDAEGLSIAEVREKSDPQAIQIAEQMSFADMPRRLRRAMGERGYNFGMGSMEVPRSRKPGPVSGHVVMQFWCEHEIHLASGDYPPSSCPTCRRERG